MHGVKFDTEKIERGLPIRWRLKHDHTDRFGLVADINESEINILAMNARKGMQFVEKKYSITQIDEFEILGSWGESKDKCCVGDPPF